MMEDVPGTTVSDKRVAELNKQVLDLEVQRAKADARPILIDEGQDGACNICAEWAANKHHVVEGKSFFRCDACGQNIPPLKTADGRGFNGIAPHHFHLRLINGSAPGRAPIFEELCLECYIKHRAKVYPPGGKDAQGRTYQSLEEIRAACMGSELAAVK